MTTLGFDIRVAGVIALVALSLCVLAYHSVGFILDVFAP